MGLSFRNQQALVANLQGADRILATEIRVIVRNAGELCREFTQALVPIDTSFMHDHVKTLYSDDGRVFETGWDEADFAAAGLAFYPIYVEFGTSKMQAQPSLYPAYQEVKPIFLADIQDAIRASIERRGTVRRARKGRGARGRPASRRVR